MKNEISANTPAREARPMTTNAPDAIPADELTKQLKLQAAVFDVIASGRKTMNPRIAGITRDLFTKAAEAIADRARSPLAAPVAEGWRDMASAPKGEPTEDAGCRGASEWFLARPSGKYGPAAPFVVIHRRPWPNDDTWSDNGETFYSADYFDAWAPLYAAPPAPAASPACEREAAQGTTTTVFLNGRLVDLTGLALEVMRAADQSAAAQAKDAFERGYRGGLGFSRGVCDEGDLEQVKKRIDTNLASLPADPMEDLLHQSRRVRNYSDPSDVFEAIPTRFVRDHSEVNIRSAIASPEQGEVAREPDAELVRELEKLERAASEVARYGACTGAQWTRLSSALITARAILSKHGGNQ